MWYNYIGAVKLPHESSAFGAISLFTFFTIIFETAYFSKKNNVFYHQFYFWNNQSLLTQKSKLIRDFGLLFENMYFAVAFYVLIFTTILRIILWLGYKIFILYKVYFETRKLKKEKITIDFRFSQLFPHLLLPISLFGFLIKNSNPQKKCRLQKRQDFSLSQC